MPRADVCGLWWDDTVKKDRPVIARQAPAIPDTGWQCPTSFPRLEAAKVLSIDTETKDNGLAENKGPGWAWEGGGHIVGMSVGTEDGHAWYFPMRHEIGGGNLNPDMVLRWAKDEFGRANQPKVGANLLYDLGWLDREGVTVRGDLLDVQYAAPLLDEHADSYSLGSLSVLHGLTEGGKGAPETALYDWCSLAYGGVANKRQAGNIWRAPAALVGPYAEADATLPLQIYRAQVPQLKEQELMPLFRLETALIPLYLKMRKRGVRVDVNKAEQVRDTFLLRQNEHRAELSSLVGGQADVNSAAWLKRAFDQTGMSYPLTEKGNPSFTKNFLEQAPGRIPELIRQIRRLEKACGTFLEGYILGHAKNGRIHCSFHPLRTDENGTVSGRLSSSNPNLQNIPAREAELRKLVRGLFLPEEGEEWFAPDYSQVEYRLMVHAGKGEGAEEARQHFRDDPKTDYHALSGALIEKTTGQQLGRKLVKNVNFGKIFGMGEFKLREMLGLGEQEAHAFFDAYDKGLPFAKATAEYAKRLADRRGYIRTILHRRARFPFWEARDWGRSKKDGWMPREQALERYGGAIRRAKTHKALNAYTQGSGGDVIKKALLDCWRELGEVPMVTVHDENGYSLPAGSDRAKQIVEIMENVVSLRVPLLVDAEWGPNWGDVK